MAKLQSRRDSRLTASWNAEGDLLIGIARGVTGKGEVMYRLRPEARQAAVDSNSELAVIVNNLGLIVLAQLSGASLGGTLQDMMPAICKFFNVTKTPVKVDNPEEALRIARETMAKLASAGDDSGTDPHIDLNKMEAANGATVDASDGAAGDDGAEHSTSDAAPGDAGGLSPGAGGDAGDGGGERSE